MNGVQVVYDVQGDAVRGPKHMGDHGLYRQSSIVLDLEGGEVRQPFKVVGDVVAQRRRVWSLNADVELR